MVLDNIKSYLNSMNILGISIVIQTQTDNEVQFLVTVNGEESAESISAQFDRDEQHLITIHGKSYYSRVIFQDTNSVTVRIKPV